MLCHAVCLRYRHEIAELRAQLASLLASSGPSSGLRPLTLTLTDTPQTDRAANGTLDSSVGSVGSTSEGGRVVRPSEEAAMVAALKRQLDTERQLRIQAELDREQLEVRLRGMMRLLTHHPQSSGGAKGKGRTGGQPGRSLGGAAAQPRRTSALSPHLPPWARLSQDVSGTHAQTFTHTHTHTHTAHPSHSPAPVLSGCCLPCLAAAPLLAKSASIS